MDGQLVLPAIRTDLFLAHCQERFPGMAAGKSQLLNGKCRTSQDVVDNVKAQQRRYPD